MDYLRKIFDAERDNVTSLPSLLEQVRGRSLFVKTGFFSYFGLLGKFDSKELTLGSLASYFDSVQVISSDPFRSCTLRQADIVYSDVRTVYYHVPAVHIDRFRSI